MAQDQNLIGVAELAEKLEAMGRMEDGKVMRAAVRAGAEPVQAAAIANLQTRARLTHRRHQLYTGEVVDPGYSAQHVRLVTTLSKDKFLATAMVGPSKRAYYATQFLERGEHGTRHMAASPWLRPAFYQHQNDIKQAIKDKFVAFLKKFVRHGGGT